LTSFSRNLPSPLRIFPLSAAFFGVVSGKFLQELVLTGRLAAGDRTAVSRRQDGCQPETERLSARARSEFTVKNGRFYRFISSKYARNLSDFTVKIGRFLRFILSKYTSKRQKESSRLSPAACLH
jgi:hypothetical protein